MIPRHEMSGLVLAGGRSSRMQTQGGPAVDKGLLVLDGVPMVQRVARFMAPWVNEVYISANQHLQAYGRYGPCIVDDPALGADVGPLAGVASALAYSSTGAWLLVLPVDVPWLPVDLVTRLAQAVQGAAPLAYAQAGGRAHPLCMIVRRDLQADLRDYLLKGGRKVLDWHKRCGAVPVTFDDDALHFANINTPEDWAAIKAPESR